MKVEVDKSYVIDPRPKLIGSKAQSKRNGDDAVALFKKRNI
jgi:hypothetical protein